MTQKTTYLITGTNRGIGKGLVEAYLSKPNIVVIATVRDPSHASATSLNDLPKAPGTSLIVVKLDHAAAGCGPEDLVESLRTEHGVENLDVVIANAGMSTPFVPVLDMKLEDVRKVTDVNVVNVLALYKAVLPVMTGSAPKLVAISAALGSIGAIGQFKMTAGGYALSKAMLNFMLCKIHNENESLIAFPIHPGWVQTDMGQEGADYLGVDLTKAAITIKESVDGMVKVIDEATREKYSGRFMDYKGEELPW